MLRQAKAHVGRIDPRREQLRLGVSSQLVEVERITGEIKGALDTLAIAQATVEGGRKGECSLFGDLPLDPRHTVNHHPKRDGLGSGKTGVQNDT